MHNKLILSIFAGIALFASSTYASKWGDSCHRNVECRGDYCIEGAKPYCNTAGLTGLCACRK